MKSFATNQHFALYLLPSFAIYFYMPNARREVHLLPCNLVEFEVPSYLVQAAGGASYVIPKVGFHAPQLCSFAEVFWGLIHFGG